MAGSGEQLDMPMVSATVTGLTNPRDVAGSLREVFDSHAAEATVEPKETRTGNVVTSVDHTHTLRMVQSLAERSMFGRGPYRYDRVAFRGSRHFKQDDDVALWEHYVLSISDGGLAVASMSFSASRIGGPETQEFSFNGKEFAGPVSSVPNILELEEYRRILPVIRVVLLIGETALIKSTPAVGW